MLSSINNFFSFKNKKKKEETSKKVVFSRPQVDGIIRKPAQLNIHSGGEENTNNNNFQISKFDNNTQKIEVKKETINNTTTEGEEENSSVDDNRRMFMKIAGVAGLGFAASALFPKSADAYVSGSTPTSNVVGLKNSTNVRINPATEETLSALSVGIKDDTNTRINPATEETLDTLLKTTDLNFDGSGYLNVNVQATSASGGGSSFSDSLDVSKFALVDTDRHVQVDVLTSALPTSASTESTLQTISFGGFKFALRMATIGNFDYVGEATIGSATSSAVWRIKRIDNTSGMVIAWAGTGVFDQVWDNYPSLTYL